MTGKRCTGSTSFRHVRVANLLAEHAIRRGSGGPSLQLQRKRLARFLLLLARFGKEGIPEPVIPKISQATLAEMIGTTGSRVEFIYERFRKSGFVD